MKSIIVGGVSGDQVSVQQGFYGCLQVRAEISNEGMFTHEKHSHLLWEWADLG